MNAELEDSDLGTPGPDSVAPQLVEGVGLPETDETVWQNAKNKDFSGAFQFEGTEVDGAEYGFLNDDSADMISFTEIFGGKFAGNTAFGSVLRASPGTDVEEYVLALPAPESVEQSLEQVMFALENNVGYYHAKTGEGQGRAFKRDRLEPDIQRMEEIAADIELENVSQDKRAQTLANRQLVVAIAKQLFAEGALELADVPRFAELLGVTEKGGGIPVEQLAEQLTDEQMKTLHKATLNTMRIRLEKAPTLWVMRKGGELSEAEFSSITTGRGVKDYNAFMQQVCGSRYTSETSSAFGSADVGGSKGSATAEGVPSLAAGRLDRMMALEQLELLREFFEVKTSEDETLSRKGKSFDQYLEEVGLLLNALEERQKDGEEVGLDDFADQVRERILRHLQMTLSQVGLQDEVLDLYMLKITNPNNGLVCYVPVDDIIRLAEQRRELEGLPKEYGVVYPLETVKTATVFDFRGEA